MNPIHIDFTIPDQSLFIGFGLLVFAITLYLAISKNWEWVKTRANPLPWMAEHYVAFLLPLGFIAISLAIYFWIWDIRGEIGRLVALLSDETIPADIRNLAYAIAALLGAVALAATIPFQLIKVWVNERLAKTTEQGHMTDRITKAVEQLGAEKTVWEDGKQNTVPNLEVRLGAIYALERIAKDSLRDHIPVMEILCAYVRNNAPLYEAVKINIRMLSSFDIVKVDQKLFSIPTARQDVQAVVTVIGRRSPSRISYEQDGSRNQIKSRYNLDLRACNLQNLDFRLLDFSNTLFIDSALDRSDFSSCKLICTTFNRASLVRVKLTNCELKGSFFKNPTAFETDISNSNLSEAFFSGKGFNSVSFDGADLTKSVAVGTKFINCGFDYSKLRHAHFTHTELNDCDFRKTDFSFSRLDDANFSDTILSEADFSNACLEHANFSFAVLEGTILNSSTEIEHAVFQLAAVRKVDFQKVASLSQSQAKEMFGDYTTKLPSYLPLPKWTERQFSDQEFYDTWEAEIKKAKATANL